MIFDDKNIFKVYLSLMLFINDSINLLFVSLLLTVFGDLTTILIT